MASFSFPVHSWLSDKSVSFPEEAEGASLGAERGRKMKVMLFPPHVKIHEDKGKRRFLCSRDVQVCGHFESNIYCLVCHLTSKYFTNSYFTQSHKEHFKGVLSYCHEFMDEETES